MMSLEILEFPDPRLRTVASQVKEVNGKVVALIDRMLELMYAAPGIGLAATQVNVHRRLLAIDISEEHNRPLVLINPEIHEVAGEIETLEGCLSIPGFYEPVQRHQHILLEAIGRDGEPFKMEASDLLAVCIQHEMNHLEGKLFVDYLSAARRQLIRKKLQKLQKERV